MPNKAGIEGADQGLKPPSGSRRSGIGAFRILVASSAAFLVGPSIILLFGCILFIVTSPLIFIFFILHFYLFSTLVALIYAIFCQTFAANVILCLCVLPGTYVLLPAQDFIRTSVLLAAGATAGATLSVLFGSEALTTYVALLGGLFAAHVFDRVLSELRDHA